VTASIEAFLSKATRRSVVCDIDGTLAFTKEAAASAVNARWGLSVDAAKLRSYRMEDTLTRFEAQWLRSLFADPKFYINVAPDFHAIDALRQLRDDGVHVTIASDRPAVVKDVTVAWLNQWDVGYDAAVLDGPGSKAKALTPPAVLIDDDPATWLTIAKDGVDVFTPERSYTPPVWDNYPHVWVFTSWADVVETLTD